MLFIFLFIPIIVLQGSGIIHGEVIDGTNQLPLFEANIIIVDSEIGTTTDEYGKFIEAVKDFNNNNESNSKNKVIEVYAQEISGIVYYLDNYNNVYKTEDIMLNKENPEIIGKYEKNSNEYTIPNLGLH